MSFVLGVVAFALALLISIAWHELGHMWAAQATGMKVRRYFVGFGPTLWSTRRGETEYGVKALPLGGFCDIAGMTPHEELTADEERRAMYRQSTWKRLVVLFAGPAQNFILGFVLIVVLAIGWGLPNLNPAPTPAVVQSTFCVAPTMDLQGKATAPCAGGGPAAEAGLLAGDRIVSVNGTPVADAVEATPLISKATGPVTLGVDRDGQVLTLTMTPMPVTISGPGPDGTTTTIQRNMVGLQYPAQPGPTKYSPLAAIPASVAFTGDLLKATWDSLIALPSKVGKLWTAVTGGARDADTPISVYGASKLGGEAVDHGYWDVFLLLLISVNFFLGAFNLIPLLPLDGGHMLIALYERVRNGVRRLFGRAAAGPVDYYRLLPLTYAVVAVMGAFMVLTLTADIINPIKIF